MTTSAISSTIRTVIASQLPTWTSRLQLDILVDRFLDGYEYGWITGDNYSCGGSHSESGARRAASRAAGRAARTCGGPAPLTAVVAMERAIDESGDDVGATLIHTPEDGHYGIVVSHHADHASAQAAYDERAEAILSRYPSATVSQLYCVVSGIRGRRGERLRL